MKLTLKVTDGDESLVEMYEQELTPRLVQVILEVIAEQVSGEDKKTPSINDYLPKPSPGIFPTPPYCSTWSPTHGLEQKYAEQKFDMDSVIQQTIREEAAIGKRRLADPI